MMGRACRALTAMVAVAGIGIAGALPASAAEQRVKERMHGSHGSTFGVKGDRLTAATGRTAIHTVLSGGGKVLSSRSLSTARPAATTRADAQPECDQSRSRKGFRFLGTRTEYADNGAYYVRFKYFSYKQNNARRHGSDRGRLTKQFEMCSIGGASSKGGNRLDGVVTMMTMRTRIDRLIKDDWDTGENKKDASSTLSFKTKGPVAIAGSIPVNPQNRLTGSQGHHKDAPDTFKKFKRNQVNAAWDGGLGIIVNAGSTNFQGNVGQALWEMPQGVRNPKFEIEAGVDYHCGRPTWIPGVADCAKPGWGQVPASK